MKTLTEKYRGVLNESFSKTQFVRDARMTQPQLINQFLGFDDTVQILKQKGMISEKDGTPEYKEFDNISDEAIRRGIDAELGAMGLMSQESISEEDHAKAKDKALKNLKKDPLHYLNLISGESNKVNKHDQMVEPKKGNEVDTFNGMKKAELKENYTKAKLLKKLGKAHDAIIQTGNGKEYIIYNPDSNNDDNAAMWNDNSVFAVDQDGEEHEIPYNNIGLVMVDESNGYHDDGTAKSNDEMDDDERNDFYDNLDSVPEQTSKSLREQTIDVISLLKKERQADNDVIKDFIKTHFNDIRGASPSEIVDEFDEFVSVNYESPSDYMQESEVEEAMSDQQMKDIQKYGQEDKIVKSFKPGDKFSTDFDYEGMLEFGMKIRLNTPITTLQALYDSFEDVNYHSENSHLGMAIDAIKDGDKSEALDHIRMFKKAIKKTLISFNEGVNPNRNQNTSEAIGGPDHQKLEDLGYSAGEKALMSIDGEIFKHPNFDSFVSGFMKGFQDNMEASQDYAAHYVNEGRRKKTQGGKVVTERVGSLQEFISLIEDRAAENGTTEAEEAEEVIYALGEHYNLGVDIMHGPDLDRHDVGVPRINEGRRRKTQGGKVVTENDYETGGYVESMGPIFDKGVNLLIKAWEEWKMGPMTEPGMIEFAKKDVLGYLDTQLMVENLEEAKGKDHDGDGDIDGDDYMAAKNKAIKKAMGKDEIVKENIKSIIQKVLEEGTINEAATQELAKLADTYGGFNGMKSVLVQLQDIVTDIESYYDKTRDKIQKAFDAMGDVSNEEGLKVGGFLSPAVETAFTKDLRPVTIKGFTKGLEQPKVRVISQRDIERHNSGEAPLGEEEKQTVFTPTVNGALRETKGGRVRRKRNSI